MAAKAKKDLTLARLMPHEIVMIDGHEVVVPNGKIENATANKLMASQMRTFLQLQVKKYLDADMPASPKDIKDLAEAAANIAKFSATVYSEMEGQITPMKQVGPPQEEDGGEFDIGDAAKPKKIIGDDATSAGNPPADS